MNLNQSKLQYLEKEFNFYYKEVRKTSHFLFEASYGYNEVSKEDLVFSKYWTHEYLKRMFNILCVYFEFLGLKEYLQNFKTTFQNTIEDENKATKVGCILLEYGDTDEDLEIFIEWRKILAPFDFFWINSIQQNELKKVIRLLKGTREILKLTNTIVKNEDSINGIMRDILDLYYDDVIAFSQGYFRHKFENYRPDIIIQELGISIEYKLVRKNTEISKKINELIIDANRYTGNYKNKECIAVFCLSDTITKTDKQIIEDWSKQSFPENWELIIIRGISIDGLKNKI